MTKTLEQKGINVGTASIKALGKDTQEHSTDSLAETKENTVISEVDYDSTPSTNNILLTILISFAGLMINVGFIIFLAWQAGYSVTW